MGVQCSVYSVWPLVNTQQMLAGIITYTILEQNTVLRKSFSDAYFV